MAVEYRVCWSASTNITFRGESEWEMYDDPTASEKQVEGALTESKGGFLSDGFEMALDLSGFEWWIETRLAEGEERSDG